jgi:hypothetical protein
LILNQPEYRLNRFDSSSQQPQSGCDSPPASFSITADFVSLTTTAPDTRIKPIMI